MPVTYTNRKGITYYLRKGQTRTGKQRYYFGREAQGELVENLPRGFTISESVNGVVSLVKDRPSPLHLQEIAAVEEAVKAHPAAERYRVAVKHSRIEVYERVGPDLASVFAVFDIAAEERPAVAERLRAEDERYTQYTPVLRFILAAPDRRIFRVERMCYLSRVDDWLELGQMGPVAILARAIIPTLGTDRFFELW